MIPQRGHPQWIGQVCERSAPGRRARVLASAELPEGRAPFAEFLRPEEVDDWIAGVRALRRLIDHEMQEHGFDFRTAADRVHQRLSCDVPGCALCDPRRLYVPRWWRP